MVHTFCEHYIHNLYTGHPACAVQPGAENKLNVNYIPHFLVIFSSYLVTKVALKRPYFKILPQGLKKQNGK